MTCAKCNKPITGEAVAERRDSKHWDRCGCQPDRINGPMGWDLYHPECLKGETDGRKASA